MSTGAVDDVGVPSAERQAWLLEQTRLLVAAVGAEPLLRAPQLEPTPAFFPDGWSPDVEGAAALTRRLLDFAHLEHLDLALVRFLNETDPDSEEGGRHAVGFFQGIESAVCHFGIHLHALTDPEKVVGVMAHEVAHAFRHHHKLQRPEPEIEEELTDLTTVYLGGGLLLANLAERVVVERGARYVSLERSSAGYLSVADFGFLLAVLLRARGAGPSEERRFTAFLGSAQAYCLRHAIAELDELGLDQLTLHEHLGIETTVASPPSTALAPVRALHPDGRYTVPWGRTVYRAQRSRAVAGLLLGAVAGFIVALMLAREHPEAVIATICLTPLVGAGLGRAWDKGYCSNSACKAVLGARAKECPGCKGHVLGTLAAPPVTFGLGSSQSRVKRVIGHRAEAFAAWGGTIGGFLGFALEGVTESLAYPFAGALLGGVLGAVIGRRTRRDLCGGRDCGTVLEDFVRVCPRCLGNVRGEARSNLETL